MRVRNLPVESGEVDQHMLDVGHAVWARPTLGAVDDA